MRRSGYNVLSWQDVPICGQSNAIFDKYCRFNMSKCVKNIVSTKLYYSPRYLIYAAHALKSRTTLCLTLTWSKTNATDAGQKPWEAPMQRSCTGINCYKSSCSVPLPVLCAVCVVALSPPALGTDEITACLIENRV